MQDKSDTQRRRSGFRTLIGYRTKEWREGYGEVELIVGPQHLNALGITHGGIYMSLLDVAMGHAVAFATVPGNVRFSTTVSLTTNFLKGAKSGSVLTAIGRIDGVEGRLATGTGEVRDAEGALCAVGQATFLFFPGSERPEGVPRP
jgi:acyl-CoA thioesterase